MREARKQQGHWAIQVWNTKWMDKHNVAQMHNENIIQA